MRSRKQARSTGMIWTVLIGVLLTNGVHGQLRDIFEWKLLKFDTPEDYPVDPKYNGNTTLITGIEIMKDRILIATPRIWPGNPASLSWVKKPEGVITNKSPILHAYPNWDMHRAAGSNNVDCNGIISVYRMTLNKCGQLLVLDSGLQSTRPYRSVCPPKILIFNAANHQLIQKIPFPSDVYERGSVMTNIVHDPFGNDLNCTTTTAYMSDAQKGALVMYNPSSGRLWRVKNRAMESDPRYERFSVLGDSFTLREGIIGMIVARRHAELYFQPFTGRGIYKIPLKALEENATVDGQLRDVSLWVNKESQSCGLAFGLQIGVIIYSEVKQSNIVFHTPGNSKGSVAQVSDKLPIVVDLKLHGKDHIHEVLWIASSRLQKFHTRSVNPSEINLRIMTYTPRYHDLEAL